MEISGQIKSAHSRLLLQDTHRACASKKGILEVIDIYMSGVSPLQSCWGVPISVICKTMHQSIHPRKVRGQLQIKHLHLICSIVTVASCNISLAFLSGVQPERSISLYTSKTYSRK
jgi:hypothetical protein